jgi:hypothetical protein
MEISFEDYSTVINGLRMQLALQRKFQREQYTEIISLKEQILAQHKTFMEALVAISDKNKEIEALEKENAELKKKLEAEAEDPRKEEPKV